MRRKFEAKNLLYKVPPHFIRLGILVFRIVVYLKLKRRKKMIITVIAIVIRKKKTNSVGSHERRRRGRLVGGSTGLAERSTFLPHPLLLPSSRPYVTTSTPHARPRHTLAAPSPTASCGLQKFLQTVFVTILASQIIMQPIPVSYMDSL